MPTNREELRAAEERLRSQLQPEEEQEQPQMASFREDAEENAQLQEQFAEENPEQVLQTLPTGQGEVAEWAQIPEDRVDPRDDPNRRQRDFNPLSPENAVAINDWVDENIGIPLEHNVRRLIDPDLTAEEVAEDRAERLENMAEDYQDEQRRYQEWRQDDPGGATAIDALQETGATLAGSGMDLVSGGLTLAEAGVDFQREFINRVGNTGRYDPTRDPLNEAYQWAHYDLGQPNNRTNVGLAGREILSSVLAMGGLGSVGIVGPGAKTLATGGKVSRLIGGASTSATRAGLAQLLMSANNPNNENASTWIQSGPLANPLSGALAHNDDDSPWSRMIKNVIEDVLIDVVVDGVQPMVNFLRRGKKSLDAGSSVDEAVSDGIRAAEEAKPLRNADQRAAESLTNSSRPGQDGFYDPNERAFRSNTTDMEDAVTTRMQNETIAGVSGGANSTLDDIDVRNIAKWSEPELIDFITNRSTVNTKKIARALGEQEQKVIDHAYRSIANFLNTNDLDELTEATVMARPIDDVLVKSSDASPIIVDQLVNEMGAKMREVAIAMSDVGTNGGDITNQAVNLLYRSQGLIKLRKTLSLQDSEALKLWGFLPRNPFKKSLAEALERADQKIDDLINKLENGSPVEVKQAKDELMDMSTNIILNNGDPTQNINWLSAWGNNLTRNAVAMKQAGVLSSITAQARNIGANAFMSIERPLTIALDGVGKGNMKQVRQTLSYFENMRSNQRQALQVAYRSLRSGDSITGAAKEMIPNADFAARSRERLEKLVEAAPNSVTRWFMQQQLDLHNFITSPWTQYPYKGLQAADDYFGTQMALGEIQYTARQKFDEFIDKYPDGKLPDGREFKYEYVYNEVLADSMRPDGALLGKVADIKERQLFQNKMRPGGFTEATADYINKYPVLKNFLLFVQTPSNVLKYELSQVPILNRKLSNWKDVMANGTETEKAVLRGREALGRIWIGTGITAYATGNLTGPAPAPGTPGREEWLREFRPYSIKIAGRWWDYRLIPGANLMFASIAALGETMQYASEGEFTEMGKYLAWSVASIMVNRTYFAGVIELSSMLNAQDWDLKNLPKNSIKFFDSFLPNVGLRNNFNMAANEHYYEFYDNFSEVLGRWGVPGSGEKVFMPDPWSGELTVNPRGGIMGVLNPLTPTSLNPHPVVPLLNDLNFTVPSRFFETYDGGLGLDRREEAELRRYFAETGVADAVENYINSDEFRRKYEYWESTRGTSEHVSRENSAWYQDISRMLGRHKDIAERRLRDNNPEFRERLIEHRTSNQPDGLGEASLNWLQGNY